MTGVVPRSFDPLYTVAAPFRHRCSSLVERSTCLYTVVAIARCHVVAVCTVAGPRMLEIELERVSNAYVAASDVDLGHVVGADAKRAGVADVLGAVSAVSSDATSVVYNTQRWLDRPGTVATFVGSIRIHDGFIQR